MATRSSLKVSLQPLCLLNLWQPSKKITPFSISKARPIEYDQDSPLLYYKGYNIPTHQIGHPQNNLKCLFLHGEPLHSPLYPLLM